MFHTMYQNARKKGSEETPSLETKRVCKTMAPHKARIKKIVPVRGWTPKMKQLFLCSRESKRSFSSKGTFKFRTVRQKLFHRKGGLHQDFLNSKTRQGNSTMSSPEYRGVPNRKIECRKRAREKTDNNSRVLCVVVRKRDSEKRRISS